MLVLSRKAGESIQIGDEIVGDGDPGIRVGLAGARLQGGQRRSGLAQPLAGGLGVL